MINTFLIDEGVLAWLNNYPSLLEHRLHIAGISIPKYS